MEVDHIAECLVHCECLITSAAIIISWGEENEVGQITPTELQADLAMVTVVTTDGRKTIPEEARLLGYSSALQGVEPTSETSFSTEWERMGEERAPTSIGPLLCTIQLRRQMLPGHRQSPLIMNWPLQNQSQGAKCYGSRKSAEKAAGVCACMCRDGGSKSILDLPGLRILTVPSPR